MNEQNFSRILYVHILQQRFITGADVFRKLYQNNIPYAVHKGAILSEILYGDVATRISSDVDLLVSTTDLRSIKEIFDSEGFVQARIIGNDIVPYTRAEQIFQLTQSHQIAPYVKKANHRLCPYVEYDCNLDIFGEKLVKIRTWMTFCKIPKTI